MEAGKTVARVAPDPGSSPYPLYLSGNPSGDTIEWLYTRDIL